MAPPSAKLIANAPASHIASPVAARARKSARGPAARRSHPRQPRAGAGSPLRPRAHCPASPPQSLPESLPNLWDLPMISPESPMESPESLPNLPRISDGIFWESHRNLSTSPWAPLHTQSPILSRASTPPHGETPIHHHRGFAYPTQKVRIFFARYRKLGY